MFNRKKHNDPFGQSVFDYYHTGKKRKISVYSDKTQKEFISSDYLFRSFNSMPELEKKALGLCKGRVYDLGAGSGIHSLYLQNKGYQVTAIDKSELCCQVMQKLGIKNIVCEDIWNLNLPAADTCLMLMNNIGICGKLSKLLEFIQFTFSLLQPNGQLLLTSADIGYLYTQKDGSRRIPLTEYYGELTYTMKYKGHVSEAFPWLFIDESTLFDYLTDAGYTVEIIHEETPSEKYLACIRKN